MQLTPHDIRVTALAFSIMALFAAVHLLAMDFTPLRRLELTALDLRLRLRGVQAPGPETVIVQIDDRALAEYGRWPLPRARYAELIQRLQSSGARVIVFDLLFAEPDTPFAGAPEGFTAEVADVLTGTGRTDLAHRFIRAAEGDGELAQAMLQAGNVVLPFGIRIGSEPTGAPPDVVRAAFVKVRATEAWKPPLPRPAAIVAPVRTLADVAAALGFSLVVYDVDGAPRYERVAQEHDLDHYPSLALRAVQGFLGVPWRDVRLELGQGVAIGPHVVETDRLMRLLINYRGPRGSFRTYSLTSVLGGAVPDDVFANRIVVIGTSIAGINDTFETPFSAVMPGVERLATVIDNLLHDGFLRRPQAMPVIEAAALLALALLIGFAVARLSALPAALIAGVLAFAVVSAGHVALKQANLWVAAALPLTALAMTFVVVMVYRHALLGRDHRRAQRAFARYLAPDMVERLTHDAAPPQLGGELRELTVLFCDIRSFAALSERMSPEELTRLINEFFTAMTGAILAHGGTIDKYIGDGVMAFWNAPVKAPDHAERACRAALDMLDRLAALNSDLLGRGALAEPLAVGIGVNTGPCVVGNFGSAHRFDYSALGDAVNIAARLEVETKQFGFPLLLGPATAAQIPRMLPQPIGHIQLRGRSESLEIFTLRRLDGRAPIHAPNVTALRTARR
jgi:adenylate cyclase